MLLQQQQKEVALQRRHQREAMLHINFGIAIKQQVSAYTIQHWFHHHSHRRSCIAHNKVQLITLATQATTIQHWLAHHSRRRRYIRLNKELLQYLAVRAHHLQSLPATSIRMPDASATTATNNLAFTAAFLDAFIRGIKLNTIVIRADIRLQFIFIKNNKPHHPTPHEFWHLIHPEPYILPPRVPCPYILPPGLPPPIPG